MRFNVYLPQRLKVSKNNSKTNFNSHLPTYGSRRWPMDKDNALESTECSDSKCYVAAAVKSVKWAALPKEASQRINHTILSTSLDLTATHKSVPDGFGYIKKSGNSMGLLMWEAIAYQWLQFVWTILVKSVSLLFLWWEFYSRNLWPGNLFYLNLYLNRVPLETTTDLKIWHRIGTSYKNTSQIWIEFVMLKIQ